MIRIIRVNINVGVTTFQELCQAVYMSHAITVDRLHYYYHPISEVGKWTEA